MEFLLFNLYFCLQAKLVYIYLILSIKINGLKLLTYYISFENQSTVLGNFNIILSYYYQSNLLTDPVNRKCIGHCSKFEVWKIVREIETVENNRKRLPDSLFQLEVKSFS